MDKEQFRRKAIERMKESREFCGKWHQTARDDYAFIAGDQWKPIDENLLRQQSRPHVTFNYSEKMIDAVAGAEVNNRQEVIYSARQMENVGLGELWTNAARWVRDECNADDEESDAFRDALICGMGWTSTRMDYTEDKDGMPVISRIDPMEMYYDPAAIKPSLADRRFDFHAAWMDNETIMKRWPNVVIPGDDWDVPEGEVTHIRHGFRYQDDPDAPYPDLRRVDQSKIWHYECVEMEPYYRVETGDGNIAELEQKDFGSMKDQIEKFGLRYVKTLRKVYYRAFFAGETLLEWGLSPCQEGFTRHCITGKRDRNKNMWYGLTRVMKDPQRWANKWLSQIMYIINTNAKGGLMAEVGAFVDPRKAQEEWSSPDSVTLLNNGGLQKVQEKQATAYPSGLAQLMEFALNSLPQVTGINLEALGLAGRDQANVLEQSRKQAAYGLLAPVFDSLRRYRKLEGRILLWFMRHYITDGRLVKIVGVGDTKFIPLTHVPDAVKFDIIVDQAPTAPDVRERTWEALMQIVPAMLKAGVPLPPDLLTYAPLPQDLIQKWQAFMLKAQQQSQVSPQQMQQMQEQLQSLQQQNQQLQLQMKDRTQELQMKWIELQQELKLKEAKLMADIQLKNKDVESRLLLDAHAQDQETTLNQQQAQHDMSLKKESAANDMKVKAAAAGLAPREDGEVSVKLDAAEISTALQDVTKMFAESVKEIIQTMNEPKQVVRDKDGNLIGVRPVAKLPK